MAGNYNNFTYIPTDEVSLSLICRVIGVRSSSVPYVLGSKKINEHSRRKPYKNIGAWGVQLYGANGNDETLIIQHNFGLTPKLITTPADSVAALTEGKQTYAVDKWGQWSAPDPYNEDDFKRMDDMCGYDKLADSHIKELSFTDPWGKTDSPSLTHNGIFKVELSFNKAENSVHLDEIHYGSDVNAKYGDKYLTVMITNKNSVRWGMDWIVVQAKVKLESVVRSAGTVIAGTYTLEFNLSNVTNAADLFGSYFLAVGLADKFNKSTIANQQTVTSYQNSSSGGNADIWLFRYNANNYPTVTSQRMPLTLYSFNMYGERLNEAMLGKMQSVQPDKIVKPFDVYASIATNSNTYPMAVSAKWATKNGVRGIEVTFKGSAAMNVQLSEIPSEYRNEGYPTFGFWVDVLDYNTGEMLSVNEYVVILEKGWVSLAEITVNGTNITYYQKQGAQNLLAGTLEGLGAKKLQDGIFIPCSATRVEIQPGIYIRGGESHGGDAIYKPTIIGYPKNGNQDCKLPSFTLS